MNAARDQSATGIVGKMTDTRKRVKLYELNADRQWDDKGTGGNVFLISFVVQLPNFVCLEHCHISFEKSLLLLFVSIFIRG